MRALRHAIHRARQLLTGAYAALRESCLGARRIAVILTRSRIS